MTSIHAQLLGALFGLTMAIASFYTGNGDPFWGFLSCGGFILAALLELPTKSGSRP